MTATLFDLELVTPDYAPELTLAERYAAFKAENPAVLDAFEAVAAEWLEAGHARVGMKAVAERIRWETGIRMGTSWKVNNSFVAFIARDLISRRPEWSERIETRVQRAAA